MEARQGRDKPAGRRLDAQHDSPAGDAGDATAITMPIARTEHPGNTMTFNHQDAAAITTATLTGPFKIEQSLTSIGLLAHIKVDDDGGLPNSARELARLIEAGARWGKDGMETTVWIDVAHIELLPIAEQAAKHLVGFGVGLFVSCEDMTSHEPGQLLPEPLRQAVAEAQRDGTLWHPLAEHAVPAAPASFG